MALQDELILKKDNYAQEVQKVVKTEVRSFSDVLKQNNQQIPGSRDSVELAVDSNHRSRCVMVYGLKEEIAGAEKP